MKKTILALAFTALAAVGVYAQTQPDLPSLTRTQELARIATFVGQTAVGQTPAFTVNGAQNHTAQVVPNGAFDGGTPACTYRLQGSNDGTNWYDISATDISCVTSAQVQFNADKPTRFVRGNLITYSTTTARTVVLTYVGR